MGKSIMRLTLDLWRRDVQATVSVSRGDTHRQLVITLMENGRPFSIPHGGYAAFAAVKPDGTSLYNDCVIKGNTIVYDLTAQTTAAEGRYDAQIYVYGPDGEVVATPKLCMVVYASTYDTEVESSTEAQAFSAWLAEFKAEVGEDEALETVDRSIKGAINELLYRLGAHNAAASEEVHPYLQALIASVERALTTYIASVEQALTAYVASVPSWAQTPQKPTYTAAEVGADAEGVAAALLQAHNAAEGDKLHPYLQGLIEAAVQTAAAYVTAHNAADDAHADIRAYMGVGVGLDTPQPHLTGAVNGLYASAKDNAMAIAGLKAQGRNYVVDTFPHFIAFLRGELDITYAADIDGDGVRETVYVGVEALETGDNLIIEEEGVPDFWFKRTGEPDDLTYVYKDVPYGLTATRSDGTVVGQMLFNEVDFSVVAGYALSASEAASEAGTSASEALSDRVKSETAAAYAEASAERAEQAASDAEAVLDSVDGLASEMEAGAIRAAETVAAAQATAVTAVEDSASGALASVAASAEAALADMAAVRQQMLAQAQGYANALVGTAAGEIIRCACVSPLPHHVTGRLYQKNLFDGQLEAGTYEDKDFTLSNVTGGVFKSIRLYVEAGVYTVSWSTAVNVVRVVADGVHSVIGAYGVTQYTLTVNAPGYLGLSFRDTESTDKVWDDTVLIQVEQGDQASAYTPYIADFSTVPLHATGKNLFDIPDITGETDATIFSVACHLTSPVVISARKEATISSNVWRFQVTYQNGDQKYIMDSTEPFQGVFKASSDNPIVEIAWRGIRILDGGYRHVQVEFGQTATEFEPYVGGVYAPAADGTLVGVAAVSPITYLFTETEGVGMEVSYNRDVAWVITDLLQRVQRLETAAEVAAETAVATATETAAP